MREGDRISETERWSISEEKEPPVKIFRFVKKAAVARGLERQPLQEKPGYRSLRSDWQARKCRLQPLPHFRSLISERKEGRQIAGGRSGSEPGFGRGLCSSVGSQEEAGEEQAGKLEGGDKRRGSLGAEKG